MNPVLETWLTLLGCCGVFGALMFWLHDGEDRPDDW